MPRWVWLRLSAIIAVVSFASASSAFAQVNFVEPPAEAAPADAAPSESAPAVQLALPDVLAEGKRLEGERRWGEAYTLYEEAVREHPDDRNLEERLTVSRLHYDLGRRYADPTFRKAVKTLGERNAVDLYLDVLKNLHRYYVESPNWGQLADEGSRALDQALADPVFIEHNLAETPRAKIERLRREIRKRASANDPATRQEAGEAAGAIAKLAQRELGLPPTVTIMEFISGATNSLDPYSAFLTPAQLDEVYSQIEGNFVGLGVELKASRGALLILKTISGSPAERAGLRAGDRIIEVDGHRTADYSTDEAADLLQGTEGSVAEIEVQSPGEKPRRLSVKREHVEVPSVDEVRMVDADRGIGYLRLTCFQKTTSRDVDVALWKLHRQGMKSLIIDLRGNPGGLLTSAVDVVDKFVDRGVIVSTRGRSKDEDYVYTAHAHNTWQTPLVVLIDGDSASASEIFAGAIRDHKRGAIVGVNSYGKGSVQGIFPLSVGGAGLRLTTAKFYSPHNLAFDRVGVKPDVAVRQAAKPVVDGEPADEDEASIVPPPENDLVLAQAIEVAGRQKSLALHQGKRTAAERD